MGFFSFTKEIAMDLGTANTIIMSDDKIIVDEPSVVALDRHTNKMIAVGTKAKMMHEKTHKDIRTIRPLRTDDARSYQDGALWSTTFHTFFENGDRCTFRLYRG